jgi:ADP-ribosyl-[dinitrogen reductase] hydrolase
MFGALIGDLVGSVYEWKNYKAKDFQPLIHPRTFLTDDSVLTVAVADAFLNGRPLVESFKDWGRRYPQSGWGGQFKRWLFSDETEPYGSFGNGAAMRVSPSALLAENLDDVLELARHSAAVTHNHPEGIKGAQTTAMAIYYARQGRPAEDIRALVADFSGYDLDRTVDSIRPGYRFDVTCQGSVPEALICALEATSFEDALRNAISLGGDSDTIAAIAGPLAEARFGIPEDIAATAWAKVPKEMRSVIEALYASAPPASLQHRTD